MSSPFVPDGNAASPAPACRGWELARFRTCDGARPDPTAVRAGRAKPKRRGPKGVSDRNDCEAHSATSQGRSEEHTSELQSLAYLVCRLLLEKKKKKYKVS